LLFFAASVAPTYGQTLVGQPIHDFTLPDLNGKFRSPSEFKGKILGIFLLGHD
jgi:peroxiredoxin